MGSFNKILSIITIKRFEKDDPLVLYSPYFASSISQKMTNDIADIYSYVYDDDSPYNLDNEISYGSNSYVISRKPSTACNFYVKGTDILTVQEADIDFNNH